MSSATKILSVVLLRELKRHFGGLNAALNVPNSNKERAWHLEWEQSWLVESGGEDYGDYKIARFDLYSAGYDASDEDGQSYNFWHIPRWIEEEGWKICRLGDFDIYSMTCSPPRFVRQLNDSRQLRAVTITIKYNERSD